MKSIITVVAALALGCTAAFAQEEPKPKVDKPVRRSAEEVFKQLDANHDEKLAFDEWKAGLKVSLNEERAARKFKKLDSDQDGSLSLEEFKPRPAAKKKDTLEKTADN